MNQLMLYKVFFYVSQYNRCENIALFNFNTRVPKDMSFLAFIKTIMNKQEATS